MRYREFASEAANDAGITKPKKPLTPAQQQRRQQKNAATQKRIRDEQSASAQKIVDLKSDLI